MINSIDILGVNVAETDFERTSSYVLDAVKNKQKTYICFAPVSTIVDCQKDSKYRDVINKSGVTNPDGVPLVWVGRLKGSKQIQRTCGPDFMRDFCQHCLGRNLRHYFYGSSQETLNCLIEELKKNDEQLNIVGSYSPPIRKVGEIEDTNVLQAINQVQPDVIWIGLGSPKQDYWMANHRDKLDVPVMLAVGAAFDFLAGTKSLAPQWIRNIGMEWFFRLCCEPKRLFKRYFIGNTVFLFLIFKDLLGFKRKS